ncbi:MAG TPA: zinc ribbon domain-containing protein [Candidatus Bathyarchaeia archaeon]|nr:zinc ribbon domain-containing protein [Candidatus Bathyarchaeia archaeon]
MSTPKPKKHELGTGVAVGLVVGGVLATIVATTDSSFSGPIGAFVGGACGAYVVYDKIGRSTIVGLLSGILSLPFFLGLSQVFVIFGLIPLPPGPQPALTELQSAVVAIALMNVLAGAVGGSILGVVRHPTLTQPEAAALPIPSGQMKYCIQCGAQLTPGNSTCPHCGVKQPEMPL